MSEGFSIAATRGYVTVGETRLSYLDWGGEGSPALLLHGITSDARAFWRAAPALAELGLRPIAMDMPGHGASDVSPGHAIDAVAGLAGGVIEALGLRGVTLIGHSWGGATALALAGGDHLARAALARVVAIDPALAMSREWGEVRLPGYAEGVGEPAATGIAAIRAKNPAWLEEDYHWKAEAMARVRRAQVEGFFLPAEPWDLVERLPRVTVPLLLLVCDPAYTVIAPERLEAARAAVAPGLGEVVHVPGTNHNMLRGPGFAPTMAALRAWLGEGQG
jgi:pimeloyl-ACP methyl ester carboxylesterase